MSHRLPEPDKPWMMRTYAGHSTAPASNELYRAQPRQGPDRPLDRLRPADADRLRRRPRAGARRGRQGRRAGRAQGRHARAAGRHPARPDEHVDDDQRDGGVAAGALHRRRRGERHRPRGAPGHDAERHHQGVPLARDLRVPARPVDAADRRHGRLHGRARAAAGTRSTSAPTTCRRPGATPVQEIAYAMSHRDRGARRGARARRREDRMGAVFGRISFFVNAGVRFVEEHAKLRAMARAVGRARPRALRRAGRAPPAASATACRSTRSG